MSLNMTFFFGSLPLLLRGQIFDEFGLNGLNSGNETEICDKHSLYKANVIEVPHLPDDLKSKNIFYGKSRMDGRTNLHISHFPFESIKLSKYMPKLDLHLVTSSSKY